MANDPAGPTDEIRDVLPDDLDASAFRVPYTFPNNNRRRVPAAIYVVLGALAVAAYLIWRHSTPMVNRGLLVAGAGLIAFGVYGFVAGWRLLVDETEALATATRTIGFPIGHASAQLTWRTLWSRPAWRLLAYSAENPPARRALVVVDAIDGAVVEWFSEDNPETEWADRVDDRSVETDGEVR